VTIDFQDKLGDKLVPSELNARNAKELKPQDDQGRRWALAALQHLSASKAVALINL
jgi:hypothetical protein